MIPDLFWLSDAQFSEILPHLPTDTRGKARADDRRVISGIVHVLKSGGRWIDAPPEYGPKKTLYNRYVYSRQREQEADMAAVQFAAQASYHPKHALSIDDRMADIQGAGGRSVPRRYITQELTAAVVAGIGDYLRSHPYWQDRISDQAKTIAKNEAQWRGKSFYVDLSQGRLCVSTARARSGRLRRRDDAGAAKTRRHAAAPAESRAAPVEPPEIVEDPRVGCVARSRRFHLAHGLGA